jgi:hypothetical protein
VLEGAGLELSRTTSKGRSGTFGNAPSVTCRAGLAAQGPAEGLKLRWRETVPCLEREVAGQLVFDQSPSDHDDLAGEKHL